MMESEAILECRSLKSIHLPSTIDFTASQEPDFQCRVVCGASRCPSVETITVAEGNPNLVVVDNVLYSRDMTILRYYPSADPRETFEIPEGVISIGAGAFMGSTNLIEVKMPDTVLRLQTFCFAGCSRLETINISSNCRFIDQYVFSETALESIHIPASVEMLYYGSFGNGCMLKTITVDPGNPVYCVVDNVLYGHLTEEYIQEQYETGDLHMPGDWLVKYPAGRDATSFTVPEGVVGIETQAFCDCAGLEEIILPDSLQSLGTYALYKCSGLTEIDLPEKLKYIKSCAFYDCPGLVTLVIPDSVEYLGFYLTFFSQPGKYGFPG